MTSKDLIQHIESLSYDELTDWLDYVDYHILDIKIAKLRRRGKVSMDHLRMIGKQRQALDEFDRLDDIQQGAMILAIKAIHRAMKPQARARQGRGNIQLKVITRYKIDRKTGELVPRHYGYYLYLRLWVSGGDRDNKKRRYKSYYIGGDADPNDTQAVYPYRHLADIYDASYEVITTKDGKQRRAKTEDTYELERLILECIDLDTTPPKIDHRALKQLQETL